MVSLQTLIKKAWDLGRNKSVSVVLGASLTPKEVRVYKRKLPCGLTPGEVVLLDWVGKTHRISRFPRYFSSSLYIDPDKSSKKLLKKKLIMADAGFYRLAPQGCALLDANIELLRAYSDMAFSIHQFLLRKGPRGRAPFNTVKSEYLSEQATRHLADRDFGLLRCIRFAQADHLEAEDRPAEALRYWVEVLLLDCSGMGNSYLLDPRPVYTYPMIPPGALKRISANVAQREAEVIKRTLRTSADTYAALKFPSFLSPQTVQAIERALLSGDYASLEQYLTVFKRFGP